MSTTYVGLFAGERTYRVNGKLMGESEIRALASTTLDFAPVLDEELARYGYPLPIPVALLGPRLLGIKTLERLRKRGMDSVSEDDFRRELRSLLRELVDESHQSLAAQQERARELEHTLAAKAADAAMESLKARGVVITADNYLDEVNRVKGTNR